jgi:hypothetical protein
MFEFDTDRMNAAPKSCLEANLHISCTVQKGSSIVACTEVVRASSLKGDAHISEHTMHFDGVPSALLAQAT